MTVPLLPSAPVELGSEELTRPNPHAGPAALQGSSALAMTPEGPIRVGEPGRKLTALQLEIHASLVSTVEGSEFSCLGARAALHARTYRLGLYSELNSDGSTAGLARDLWDFARARPAWDSPYTTFIACFERPSDLDEVGFEASLWGQLERLSRADVDRWDPAVSADPDDPRYSFSFAGTAFFVVGLHAAASRLTRRFVWPTLVFNAHEQFDRLREAGKFASFQRAIQTREMQLQGSLNPNLSEYGQRPENRQYSGRAVDASWRCPMHDPEAG